MTTLVELLKINKQEGEINAEITHQMVSFLNKREDVKKALLEAVEYVEYSKDTDFEAGVQLSDKSIFLKAVNSRTFSFIVTEINKENNFIPCGLIDVKIKIESENNIDNDTTPQLLKSKLIDISVEVYSYNSQKLDCDKVLYYLEKVIGVED